MRYNEITTTEAGPVAGFDHSFKAAKGRTDKTILRALVKDFGGPLNKSMSEYNQGIKERNKKLQIKKLKINKSQQF